MLTLNEIMEWENRSDETDAETQKPAQLSPEEKAKQRGQLLTKFIFRGLIPVPR